MLLAIVSGTVLAGERVPPVHQISINADRAIEVNGKPFFPLMAWLQEFRRFPCGQAVRHERDRRLLGEIRRHQGC